MFVRNPDLNMDRIANNVNNNVDDGDNNTVFNRIVSVAKKVTLLAGFVFVGCMINEAINEGSSFDPRMPDFDSMPSFPVIPACQERSLSSYFHMLPANIISETHVETGPETPLCQRITEETYFSWKEKNSYTQHRALTMKVDCIGKKDPQCKIINEIDDINLEELLKKSGLLTGDVVSNCIESRSKSPICEDIALKAVQAIKDSYLTYRAVAPCVGKGTIACDEAVYAAFSKIKNVVEAKKLSIPVSPQKLSFEGADIPEELKDLFRSTDRDLEALQLLVNKCINKTDPVSLGIVREFNELNLRSS